LLKNILEKPEMSLAKMDKISEKQMLNTESRTRDVDKEPLLRKEMEAPKPMVLTETLVEQSDKNATKEPANIAANVKMEKLSLDSNSQTLQKNDRLYGGLPKEKVVSSEKLENTSATVGVRLATATPPSSPNYDNLFSKFKIEVKDSKVVITGEDGSIYEGEFIDDSKSEKTAVVKKGSIGGQDNQPKLMESETTQSNILSFIVKGTNKTLNKPIEFTGKFVADVSSEEKTQVVARRGLALNGMSRLGEPTRYGGVGLRMGRNNNEQPKVSDTVKSQTNIVEGVLSLNGLTNITIRAVINQDGFYQRETN